jgi:hypothetical protein
MFLLPEQRTTRSFRHLHPPALLSLTYMLLYVRSRPPSSGRKGPWSSRAPLIRHIEILAQFQLGTLAGQTARFGANKLWILNTHRVCSFNAQSKQRLFLYGKLTG